VTRVGPITIASVAMQREPDGGRTKRGRPRKTCRQTFREDLILQEMRVSWSGVRRVAHVVFAEWPVIGVGGKISSPNAPAGVENLSLSLSKSGEVDQYEV